jgi:hypothetical protein
MDMSVLLTAPDLPTSVIGQCSFAQRPGSTRDIAFLQAHTCGLSCRMTPPTFTRSPAFQSAQQSCARGKEHFIFSRGRF